MIIEQKSSKIDGILIFETTKKLYKMTNSNLPRDFNLNLPKIIFTSEVTVQKDPSEFRSS